MADVTPKRSEMIVAATHTTTLLVGSIVFLAIILLCHFIAASKKLSNQKGIIILLCWGIGLSFYLLWFCCYASQLNPIVSLSKNVPIPDIK